MAASATWNALPSRTSLSNASSTFFATLAAMTFSASGAAPTPLYQQYQESFGLTLVHGARRLSPSVRTIEPE